MKKLFFLILVISFSIANAQNDNISPLTVNYNGNDTTLSNTLFPQNDFILSWQWGTYPKFTEAMNMNCTQCPYYTDFYNDTPGFAPSGKFNTVMGYPTHFPIRGMSILYEPTLEITNPGDFIMRNNDQTHAIFGFEEINAEPIITNTSDVNFNRLVLLNDADYVGDTVLQKPWIGTEFYCFNKVDTQTVFNGMEMQISINLRRLDTLDSIIDDSTVLKIQIPYWVKEDTLTKNYINFCLLPDTNNLRHINYRDDRGYIIDCNNDTLTYTETELTITRAMLPYFGRIINSDTLNSDITITAKFLCNEVDAPYSNPFLKNKKESWASINSNTIVKMGIEVIYEGNTDVAIDWIRISNPLAQNVLEGKYDITDKIIGQMENDSGKTLQEMVQTLIDDCDSSNTYNFFRFYFCDGDDGNVVYNWETNKYFNKLFGGLGIASIPVQKSELGHQVYKSEHYLHYVEPETFWANITGFKKVAVPYYAPSNAITFINDTSTGAIGFINDVNYLGFDEDRGYRGFSGYWREYENNFKDSLGNFKNIAWRGDTTMSMYETWLKGLGHVVLSQDNTTILEEVKNEDIEDYVALMSLYTSSVQAEIEYKFFEGYYYNPAFLYSDIFWWNQIFVASNWEFVHVDPSKDYYDKTIYSYFKPHSGEETRFMAYSGIIRGCKGIAYDRPKSEVFADTTEKKMQLGGSPGTNILGLFASENVILDNLATDNMTLLEMNELGGDYICEAQDSTNMQQYIDFDEVPEYLGVQRDKIYIGLKSERLELRKIHDWIEHLNNSSDNLMNLRLSACYSKSFKTWYTQDADISTDTILKNFISLDQDDYKIWPVDRYKYTVLKEYEPWDSTFFDISLLRNKNDDIESNPDAVYIGIQNRRTDPLIYVERGSDHYMEFIPTAKFDSLVQYGGSFGHFGPDTTMSAAQWQEWWWKRLGCREITIPFDFKKTGIDSNDYCLLKITELGQDMYDTDTNQYWYLGPKYHSTVDTVIGQDKDLTLRFLPGEGKILKVEILPPPDSIKGHLAHSNQSKIVSFPYYDGTRKTDSIYYHATYFKEDSVTKNEPYRYINQVYYRRSKLLSKNSDEVNIEWDDEICVSDLIDDGGNILDSISCDYPSIVVRIDDTIPKAYIVYSCECLETENRDRIVETILEINDMDFYSISDENGEVIAFYNIDITRNREVWGNPVINASYNGNYYAWSDSTNGIVAAFKAPSSTILDSSHIIYLSYTGSGDKRSQHPALNTYSNIDSTEDNCALVWQERIGASGNNSIVYTRLHMVNDTIVNYSAPNQSDEIIELEDSLTSNNYYPTIVRPLSLFPQYWHYNNGSVKPNNEDCVIWEHLNSKTGTSELYGRRIIIADSLLVPLTLALATKTKIIYRNDNFYSPNLGNSYPINQLQYIRPSYTVGPDGTVSASAAAFGTKRVNRMNLNFVDGNNIIWHYSTPTYSSVFTSYSLNGTPAPQTLSKVSDGAQPHLSQTYEGMDESAMWKRHRIFEDLDSGIPPDILTSSQYFYRSTDNDIEVEPVFGFRLNNDSSDANYLITTPKLDDEYIDVFLPYGEIYDETYGSYYIPLDMDTIISDAFTVESTASLEFKCLGVDTTKFNFQIYCEDTDTYTNVPLPEMTNDTAGVLRIYLINGQSYKYRLYFIDVDTTGFYTEELHIGGLVVDDTVSSRANSNRYYVIDLNGSKVNDNYGSGISLSAYPNPANDMIFATANFPVRQYLNSDKHNDSRITIKLFSNLGKEIYSTEIIPGETISIPIENLQQGAYFLKAEEKTNRWGTIPLTPATEPIIISR